MPKEGVKNKREGVRAGGDIPVAGQLQLVGLGKGIVTISPQTTSQLLQERSPPWQGWHRGVKGCAGVSL